MSQRMSSAAPAPTPAGRPVGPQGTRVTVAERPAWQASGFAGLVVLTGLSVVQPGRTKVVQSFGRYVGTLVAVQAESALRHVRPHPYDGRDDEVTLRGSTDQVSDELAREVAARITVAGVEVPEVRISHLAHAQEIARAMLQRQQASAVVAARSMIVEGAVGTVELARDRLSACGTVGLGEERKAVMVSHLRVLLCDDPHVTPIVDTGTLYA